MNDNKKYYWLKLNEAFFEDDTIEWIEEQENGERYVLFYLKLCLKSLKEDGNLIRYVGETLIPYDIKALSKLTNTNQDTVAVSLKVFEEIGLIERKDTGEIYMKQINEMIGSETEVAKRVRKHRAKSIMLQSNGDVTKSNTEIERELEIDLEKETELELEPKTKCPPVPYEVIKEIFNSTCKSLSQIRSLSEKRKKHLKARWEQLDCDLEVFKEVFEKVEASSFCKGSNDRGWKVDFDWLIGNDNNILKVLEGKYDDKEVSNSGTSKSDNGPSSEATRKSEDFIRRAKENGWGQYEESNIDF